MPLSTRIYSFIRQNLLGLIAIFIALSGTAYAANTVGSTDIIDGEVKTADIGNNAVTKDKIANGSVTREKLTTGAVTRDRINNGAVDASKLAPGAVKSDKVLDESLTNSDLGTDSVQATEVADNSIDAGEIIDFGLSNEDVGVLGAQVNVDGTLASAAHAGTTSLRIGQGVYEVDFGVNVTNCTAVATQGEAGVGGALGAIMGVTDRAGNAEAFFVTTRSGATNDLTDTPFQLVVVC